MKMKKKKTHPRSYRLSFEWVPLTKMPMGWLTCCVATKNGKINDMGKRKLLMYATRAQKYYDEVNMYDSNTMAAVGLGTINDETQQLDGKIEGK